LTLQCVSAESRLADQRLTPTHRANGVYRLRDGRVDLLAPAAPALTHVPGHDQAECVELVQQARDSPRSEWLDADFHARVRVGSVNLTCRDVPQSVLLVHDNREQDNFLMQRQR